MDLAVEQILGATIYLNISGLLSQSSEPDYLIQPFPWLQSHPEQISLPVLYATFS